MSGESFEVDIAEGTIAKDLADKYQKDLKYRVLAVKVDNRIYDLHHVFLRPCNVELLDMRTQSVNRVYQSGACLIYLKAVSDVLGKEAEVDIQNSLNKGVYTEVQTKSPITDEDIAAVEKRMHELVEADLPIEKHRTMREDALKMLEELRFKDKERMLRTNTEFSILKYYTLGDYKNFFYTIMVPSTGYIERFELRKYRRGVLLRFPQPGDPNSIPSYTDEANMYRAFGETNRWQKLLGINNVVDLNQKMNSDKLTEIIQMSEALHNKRIVEIAEEISSKEKRIVLIAGPSSSGKTTFAKRLCIQLRIRGLKPLYLGTDDYYLNRNEVALDEDGEKNYEDIEAIDLELFNRDMNSLLAGKKVDIPTFDFITGKKVFGKLITSVEENAPIVIEGIHALNGRLTENIPNDAKYKIYISPLTQVAIDRHNRLPTTDSRMLRRLVRDYRYRDYSAEDTIARWPKVRAGEDKNIFPYSNEADTFFNSMLIYEICVLKKYAAPLLRAVTPDKAQHAEAVRMLKFLEFFTEVDADELISNDSILREFIGGSIYV